MEYKKFKDIQISRLGFGAMRLPVVDGNPQEIDQGKLDEMVDLAMSEGINYFDTAFSYHGGMSEVCLGKSLRRYHRNSFYLASKMPGHELNPNLNPKATFEKQLEKCGVDYFDFYLLHNVCELSIDVYTDENLGIVDYLLEQKEKGKIKYLGFSTHASFQTLRHFLDIFPNTFDFVQLQLNYLDWTMQDAGEKYILLRERNLPVIVMEPVRGGTLANLEEKWVNEMKALRPDESVASWAFRFLKMLDGVQVVLSGMSNLEQMKDNIKTFSSKKPLKENELALLKNIAENLSDMLPCTACRYCTKNCPLDLDIPRLLKLYNEAKFSYATSIGMAIDALPENKRPSACIGCGNCKKSCPQGIDIPTLLKDFDEILKKQKSWSEICEERRRIAEGK